MPGAKFLILNVCYHALCRLQEGNLDVKKSSRYILPPLVAAFYKKRAATVMSRMTKLAMGFTSTGASTSSSLFVIKRISEAG